MTYLLQVSTCWILFYGIYLLFLRKETFFSINRYYLMGTLVAGLIIPLLGAYLPANEASVEVYQVMTNFTTAEVTPQIITEDTEPLITWWSGLWTLYILGGLVVFSRFSHGLYRIFSIYKGAQKTKQQNFTLVESNKYHLPFSFFHFIFISKKLPLNNEVEKVLKHEELHANQWHSIDIVFTELLQVFFWFNPILILYKSALRQSHEYLADAYVTKDHNRSSYGQLLLRQSTSGLEIALANQFFHSQIKKRITMMYKEKSKRSAMIKYLAAVPVLVAMLLIFSSNQKREKVDALQSMGLEEVYTPYETEIRQKLLAKGVDIASIDHNNPSEIAALENALNEVLRSTFDFDIQIEKDGTYTFPPTSKRTDDINAYFKAIKDENRSVVLNVNPEADSKHVTTLLDCASNIDLKVILSKPSHLDKNLIQGSQSMFGLKSLLTNNTLALGSNTITILSNGAYMHDHTPITDQEVEQIIALIKKNEGQLNIKVIKGAKWEKVSKLMNIASQMGVRSVVENQNFPENFNGRRFTKWNWKEFYDGSPKGEGKIVINAEANKDGKMTYVEINADRSTITDREVLKNALSAARGYRIEPGEGEASGTIILNLNSQTDRRNYHDVFIKEFNYGEEEIHNLEREYQKEKQGDPIFKVVEEMPRFPGCEDMEGTAKEKELCAKQKMLEFIYKNLRYPAEAREASIEGMVVLQFIIEKDGSISGTKTVRDIGGGCGEESMSVVNKMPTWIPGKQGGKAVRVQYTLPVKFKLESQNPKKDIPVVVGHGESNDSAKKNNLHISKPKKSVDMVNLVEEMPRFPGCEDDSKTRGEKEECAKHEMLKFIYTNIKYPKAARDQGIDGVAVVQMYIDVDGSVKDVRVVRNPGGGTGEEAARVVRSMPKWIPGKQGGKIVKVQYTLPVKFKLDGEEKGEKIEATAKSSLTYTSKQFKNIKSIKTILKDAGLKTEATYDIINFKLVQILAPKSDAHLAPSENGEISKNQRELILKARHGSRYFFENISASKQGIQVDLGSISIAIKEDLLQGKTTGVDITNGEKSNIVLRSPDSGLKPLFVIDGVIQTETVIEELNPDDIAAINILKGEKALEKYGKKAENGVVEITMKTGKQTTQYLIDGHVFDEKHYSFIDKNHILKESAATVEDKFMRGIKGDLIEVHMREGYGYNPAFYPGTNTKDDSQSALLSFVGNNISYPKQAMDNNIEGMVTVRYTVDEEGSLAQYKIVKSVGWGIDEAVLAMMKKMKENVGNWKPANIDKRNISSSMTLPVKFKLEGPQLNEAKSRKLKVDMLDISPNPNTGTFNLSFELEDNSKVDILFYSLTGQLIKSIKGVSSNYRNSIDLSEHRGQTVLVNIVQNDKVHTNKVIIQ